jgi:glycosyltransferase involved in cell wall biosynthesis
MEISVVIPTLNRIKDIRECLAALEKQDLPKERFEIIIVDNGSTDGTKEFLKEQERLGKIRFLEEKKKGAGVARNLAVKTSKSEFIAFTDDDCIPEPDWLSELLNAFPEEKKWVGVGGPVLTIYKKNAISRYCEHCRVWKEVSFGGKSLHITTMNSLYRRSALLDVGIFDVRIWWVEDIHLSQKMTKKGYYLKNIDKGVVSHKDPQDLGTLYRKGWVTGAGIAMVARIEGMNPKKNITPLLGVLFPKKRVEKFTKQEKQSLYEKFMFGLSNRAWNLGVHNGYSNEMKKSHL